MPYYDFDSEEERRRREQEAIRDAYFQEWKRQNNSAKAPKVKAAKRKEMAAANIQPVMYGGNVNPNNDQLPAMTTAEMAARQQARYMQEVAPAADAAAAMIQNAPVDQYMMKRFLPNISDKSLEQTFAEAAKIDPNAKPAEPVKPAIINPYTSALDQAALIRDQLIPKKEEPKTPKQSALQGVNVPDGGIQQPNYASKNPVIPQPSAQETYTPDEELQIADINVKTLPKDEQKKLDEIAKKQEEAYSVPMWDYSNIDSLDNYNVMLKKAEAEKQMVQERDEFKTRNNLTDQQMSNFLYYQQMLNDKKKDDTLREGIRESLHTGSRAKDAGNAAALNIMSVMNSPYRGATAIAGNVAQRVLGNRPDGFGIQNTGEAYRFQNFSDAVQQETGNRIAETRAGELGRTAYGIGTSIAESGYNMMLANGAMNALAPQAATGLAGEAAEKAVKSVQKLVSNISLVPFGANAYQSTYQEERNRGVDEQHAQIAALFSGAAEVITEKIPMDDFWDVFKGKHRNARKLVTDMLAHAGIEGLEEIGSDVINNTVDAVIMGEQSELRQRREVYEANGESPAQAAMHVFTDTLVDMAKSGIGGTISGLIMGGVGAAGNVASTMSEANQMYNANTHYNEIADSIDTNRDNYQNQSAYQSAVKAQEIASDLDQKQRSGQRITNRDKFNLYTNTMDAVQTESATQQENARKQEEKAQLPKEDTTLDTTTETTAPTTEQATPTTKQTAPSTEEVTANEKEPVTPEQNEEVEVPESNVSEENNVTSDIPEQYSAKYVNDTELAEQLQNAKNPQELVEAYQNAVDTRQGDEHELTMAKGYYDAYALKMAKAKTNNYTLEDIAKAAETTLSAQRAYEAGLNEQQIDKNVLSSAAQQAYNDGLQSAMIAREKNVETQKGRLAQLMENYPTAASKQAFQRNYIPGMNADTYSYAFDRAYNAGRQVDTFVSDPAQITANIDKAWSNFKRQNGIVFSRVTEQQAQKMFYDGMETASKDMIAATSRSQAEKLLGRKATGIFTDERTNPVDDDSNRFLTGYAMATGINIRVVDSLPDGSNGYYKDGEIVINASKGKNLVTLFHEFGEFTDSMSPEQFQPIVKSGMQVMEEIMGAKEFQAMRKNYEKAYAYEFANNGKTDADLDKEIFCDQLFNIMSHEDGIEKFFQKLDENATPQQAKTFKEKLSEILGKIIDSFKNLISGQKLNSYQRQVAEDSLLRMQDLQDRVIEAMANAVNTYQQLETAVHKEMGKDAVLEYDQNGDFQMASSKDADSVLVNLANVRESKATLPTTLEKLRNVLEKKGTYSKEDIDYAIESIERQAQLLDEVALGYREMEEALQAELITDITGKRQVLHSLVKNGEYPINVDFSTICKKRQAYMRILEDLIDDGTFESVSYSPEAIVEVNKILRDREYETACLGCFVESRRLRIQQWAETFVDAWNEEVRKATGGRKVTPFNFAKNAAGDTSLTDAEIAQLEREYKEAPRKNKFKNLNLGKGKVSVAMARLLEQMPSIAHTLEVADVIKPNGVTNLRSTYGDLYSLLRRWYGSNTPKINQAFSPYNGEFADLSYTFLRRNMPELYDELSGVKKYQNQAKAEIIKEKGEGYVPETEEVDDRALRKYLYDVGGARLQSFSDFLIEQSLDYFQLIGDLAAKEYPMHAYSKEIAFLRMFGMTGIKGNMSLIGVVNKAAGPEMAGLNPDGSYAGWGDFDRHIMMNGQSFIQSIGWKDAIALMLDPRYSKHIGTIAIGLSDAHIKKMLDDPLIRMIIPYHKSGMNPEYAKAMDIDFYTNYEDEQNTTVKQYYDLDGNKVNGFEGKVKVDLDYSFNEAAQRLGDARAAANEYLEWCAKEHPVYVGKKKVGTATFTPKFEKFSYHNNYYKVLEDFNMYDAITEEYAPQQAVTMTYPGADNALTAQQLKEYEQRLRNTGEFTEEDIQKYVEKAQMSLEDIIRREASKRNEYHRKADAQYDETYNEIKDALKKYESTPQQRREDYEKGKSSKPRNSVDVETASLDQIEKALPIQERFSVDVPVEQTKDLIAVHNLTADQLLGDIALGGFPSPSIAIIRQGMGHSMYGPISVIFDKDTIDPERNKSNRVFSQDAWTPNFPSVEYKVSDKKLRSIEKRIRDLVPRDIEQALSYLSLDEENASRKINSADGDPVEAYANNDTLKYAYLMENGKEVTAPTRETRLSSKFSNNAISQISEMLPDDEAMFDDPSEFMRENPDLIEQIRTLLNDEFRNKLKNRGTSNLRILQKDLYSELRFSDFDNIIRAVDKFRTEGITQETDSTALREAVDNQIDEQGYREWLSDLFDGVIEKKGLRNEKSVFTNSGNRRTWDQLHYDYDLENIVKIMSAGDVQGAAAGFAPQALQAISSKEFKSIDDIRRSKNQLMKLTDEEYKEIKDKYYESYNNIVTRLAGSDASFEERDNAADTIVDAIRRFKTAPKIEAEIKRWYKNAYNGIGQDIVELRDGLASMPTGYFEAKPRRAVWLDEVSYVVLPGDSPKELFQALDDNGIKYRVYEAENEVERQNIIDNLENVRFSKDVQDLRRAVDAPEVDFTEMIASKNDDEADVGIRSVLDQGSKILKGQQVDQQMVRKLARRLTRKFKSTYDINQYADDVARVFAYAQSNDIASADSEELVRIMTEVAMPVIKQAQGESNEELKKEIRRNVRGLKLDLSEQQHKEVVYKYKSYQNYKQAMRKHGIEISANGASMDGSWGEIVDKMMGTLTYAENEGNEPILLLEALDSLDQKIVQNGFGMNNPEAAKDLAMDMIAGYFDEMGKKQTSKASDKDIAELKKQVAEAKKIGANYKAQIKKEYEERYDEALKDLLQARQLADKNVELQLKAIKEQAKYDTQEKLDKLKAEYNIQDAERLIDIAALRAQNRHDIQRKLEAKRKAKQKSEIQKGARQLLNMLANPTNAKHVPISLEAPVLDLLSSIDFVGPKIDKLSNGRYQTKVLVTVEEQGQLRRRFETYEGDTYQDVMRQYQEAIQSGAGSKVQQTWQQKLSTVKDLYSRAGTEGDSNSATDLLEMLDKSLLPDLQKILDDNEGLKSISSLSAGELKTINNAIKNITKAINKIDMLYTYPESVSKLGNDIIEHARNVMDTNVRSRARESLKDFFTLDNATPETYFHGLGKSGEKMFKILTRANNVKARDIRIAQEYMADLLKDVSQKDIDSMTGEKAKIIYEEGSMKLDIGDVMYLYMLLKRQDAESHKYGGFEMDDKEIKGKVYRDTKPHFLDEKKLRDITDKLTPKQKEIAEKMQQFLAVNCSEWGNETAIMLYGYEKFTDPNYIPMTVDKKTVRTNAQNSAEGMINSIRESGFTKKVIPNASNPLIIRNIFDVFSEHVTNMAAYHAYAAPLTDLIRWNNYKTTEEIKEGDAKYGRQHTVKEAIDDIYGKGGQSYLVQLVRDINQMEKQTKVGTARFGGALTSRYKAAATLANLRVVAQQPTAWFRAGEMIDAKYLAAGLAPNKAADKMQAETSDISWIKSQGNIDGYITHSMKQTITRASSTREKINDAAGWLASKADDVTWNKLYRAVYAEQLAKYNGDLSSEEATREFAKKVNDRFDEVIARTQVVDGTLMRSQLMRSSDRKNISVSAFMAEPTKSYNMFLRDYIDLTQGAKENKKVKPADLKHLSRTAAVYLVTNVANAVMQSIFDAERDDDDDKSYIEKLLNAFGIDTDSEKTFKEKTLTFLEGNFMDDLNMLNNIPIINDMYEMVWQAVKKTVWGENTYNSSTSDFDVAGLSELVKAWNYTWDKIKKNENTKVTLYGAIAQDVKALSQVSGIPVYNLMRECVALYNTLNDAWGGENIRRSKPTSAQLAKPVFDSIDTGSDYKAAIEKAVEKGSKYETIETNITKQYKQQYIDLMREGKTDEAAKLENRLMMIYDYLNEKEGQKPSNKNRVKKFYTDWQKENGVEQIELTGGSESSGSRMIDMTNVESIDVPISDEPANIWGPAFTTRKPRGTSSWTSNTSDWEKTHHINAARMIQESFQHGYDAVHYQGGDFARNAQWHLEQINKPHYARKKTYGSGGGNAVAWKSPD